MGLLQDPGFGGWLWGESHSHASSSWVTQPCAHVSPAPVCELGLAQLAAGLWRAWHGRAPPGGCPSLLLCVWVPPAGRVPRPQLHTGVYSQWEARGVGPRHSNKWRPSHTPTLDNNLLGQDAACSPPMFASSEPTSCCQAGTAPAGAMPSLPVAPGVRLESGAVPVAWGQLPLCQLPCPPRGHSGDSLHNKAPCPARSMLCVF